MMEQADVAELGRAKALLERPGLAVKVADAIGRPIDWGVKALPSRASEAIAAATRKALERALDVALRTIDAGERAAPRDWLHKATVLALGAGGGAVGLAALPVELPVSTIVMLRSIADHARAQGEDLTTTESRLNCLAVLALGGRSTADDAAGMGYFAVRSALARSVAEAVAYVADRTVTEALADRSAPAVARLVSSVAARFAPAVADKVAAQLVPVVGAVGGAAVNALFMDHFQACAWGHFTVRRLERLYGADAVRAAYDALPAPD